ncbi:hypothetical protein NDU88_000800 [Pleurodeles waltl]|uniref:Uncharacterized protein n=1 Tax=Pleurodeles waltl TaxID=8319 RepID=A0AAV7LE29_PLEWA|nr:hypothetical protein NDU88_000800 [Pleurodeles waltl]
MVICGTSIALPEGARSKVEREPSKIEDQLNALEKVAAANTEASHTLQAAHITHADLLESLRYTDYCTYTQKTHAEADKSGSLLARLIRPPISPTPILTVNDPSQEVITIQIGINDAFKDYCIHCTLS